MTHLWLSYAQPTWALNTALCSHGLEVGSPGTHSNSLWRIDHFFPAMTWMLFYYNGPVLIHGQTHWKVTLIGLLFFYVIFCCVFLYQSVWYFKPLTCYAEHLLVWQEYNVLCDSLYYLVITHPFIFITTFHYVTNMSFCSKRIETMRIKPFSTAKN